MLYGLSCPEACSIAHTPHGVLLKVVKNNGAAGEGPIHVLAIECFNLSREILF